MPPAQPLTVAILAGGRGSRLGGVDKAALELAGQPLLEHVLRAVGPLASQVVVVANDDRLAGDPRLTVVRDPQPHAGVLPALLAALDAATAPLVLLLACDMPFVSRAVLDHLLQFAPDHDVVIPFVEGYDQPMLALYRVAECATAIRAAVARGDRRMISFLAEVRTLRVPEADVRRLDPELRSFFNVNTPDDLALAATIAAAT